jgi:pyruvate dehydrogenase E2 component (dihydrolipoamide acetyltransferase)
VAEIKEVQVPDIGDFKAVEVIEVLVAAGDRIAEEDPLITLETDKASMDIPSPSAGRVAEVKVKVGDKVDKGSAILLLEPDDDGIAHQPPKLDIGATVPEGGTTPRTASPTTAAVEPPAAPPHREPPVAPSAETVDQEGFKAAHAVPSVRRFARELGVDLSRVSGSGRKGRILKEDVQGFVKEVMQGLSAVPQAAQAASGMGIPPIPAVDFAQFGEIQVEPLHCNACT